MRNAGFDVETTIRNMGEAVIGTSAANPFHPDNFVVAHGVATLTKRRFDKKLAYRQEGEPLEAPWWLTAQEDVLIVGANLPFDLKWTWREWPELFWAKLPTLYIWDIQQAEYLLSGQDKKFASLDEMSEERGLPIKDKRLKEDYWDKGIDTTMIPKPMLMDYLGSTDIENPLKIFDDQWGEMVSSPKLLNLAKVKMDDILMTTVMEIHGMQFDLDMANEHVEVLDARIETLRKEIEAVAMPLFVPHFTFNADSDDHIALSVWGGKYKIKESVPVKGEDGKEVRFKTGARKGEVKTRQEWVYYTTKGLGLKTGIAPVMKNGLYSSAEEYLMQHPTNNFVKNVVEFRGLVKDVDTYWRGYAKLVFPDGKLHPSYNHPATETGRQSCSAPNLQNVTKPDEE